MSVLAFVAAFVLNHGTTVTMVIISNGNRKRQWQTITVTKPKAEINFICGRCVYVSIVCDRGSEKGSRRSERLKSHFSNMSTLDTLLSSQIYVHADGTKSGCKNGTLIMGQNGKIVENYAEEK